MTHNAKGHQPISTTLRTDEVTILDEHVERMEFERKEAWRKLEPGQHPIPSNVPVTRAGVNRAAVRYALEHMTEFEAWLADERELGVDDAQ